MKKISELSSKMKKRAYLEVRGRLDWDWWKLRRGGFLGKIGRESGRKRKTG